MHSFLRGWAVLGIAAVLALTACGGGGGGTTPTLQPTPPPDLSADCPSSGASPVSAASALQSVGRLPSRGSAAQYVPGAIAVQYQSEEADAIDEGVRSMHSVHVTDLAYRALGLRSRVLSVNPQNVDAAIAHLRSLPGVKSVTRVAYRQRMSITANDPFYTGVNAPPFDQTPATHGQWDMHVINLDAAWSLFGTAVTAAPIAVIDTGVDVSHAEMRGGKVVRAQCYVTYPSGSAQTSGQYVTDTDGHGTNVAGIADAFTNNAFGFAGTAYDAPLLAYRIFPSDPAGGCDVPPGQSAPAQCNTDTADEATAINDAVQHGAKVINLSLGGAPPCNPGDPEYMAVENAIKSGVVVVAAAGNGDAKTGLGLSYLYCPAADPGVIAVGASALDDTAYPVVSEVTASYSNYLPSNKGTSFGGAYLLAPGGDVTSSSDVDNLHWIQNIYSSNSYDAGLRTSCNGGTDSYNETGNCNVEIIGTSMSVPHVVGVVSLMRGIKPSLTPAQIAAGLCSTAHDIGDTTKEGCGRLDASAAVSWAKSQP